MELPGAKTAFLLEQKNVPVILYWNKKMFQSTRVCQIIAKTNGFDTFSLEQKSVPVNGLLEQFFVPVKKLVKPMVFNGFWVGQASPDFRIHFVFLSGNRKSVKKHWFYKTFYWNKNLFQ